jgi:hypothetical protein
MESLVQFLFIVVLPLVVVAGGLVTLFAVGALFDALEHPDELRTRIDDLFRQPPAPARQTAANHYYRPHWRQS